LAGRTVAERKRLFGSAGINAGAIASNH